MDLDVATKYSHYFEDVLTSCANYAGVPGQQKATTLCVVIHAFDNIFPFLETLQQHFTIAALIFKGSREVHRDVVELARQKGFPVRDDLSRGSLLREDVLCRLAEEIGAARLINLDYGGYLCEFHRQLSGRPRQPLEYLGVVEGTENGFQRYQRLLHGLAEANHPVPLRAIVSGARSLTKDCYDAHIGESLVEGCRYALLKSGVRQLEDFSCVGVLGYGKIGRSTALHLREVLHDCELLVCEVDPERAGMAQRDGFALTDIDSLVDRSQLIFSITGAAALTDSCYDRVASSGKLIACGTSSDDELALQQRLASHALKSTDTAHFDSEGTCVTRHYKTRGGHSIELLGDGRTINTLMKSGSQHPTLALTEGCYIAQIFSLLSGRGNFVTDSVNAPDHHIERLVFELWRKHFAGGHSILAGLRLPMLNVETLQALEDLETELQGSRDAAAMAARNIVDV